MNLPITRYYGSKRRLLDKIWDALCSLQIEFESVLDLFGGTGIVSYYMAKRGKNIIYNDIFSFNCEIAKALLCSPRGIFTEDDAKLLLKKIEGRVYKSIIANNFNQIYYTSEENEIIDIVIQNIQYLDEDKKASAYYVLFQSCMIKRPFNLFHRRNLNLRTNFVTAHFGNKVTWEQSFDDLFLKFTKELNEYQFEVLPDVEVINVSALNCFRRADLIYIDTPYFSKKGTSNITYHNRYHFLEGLMNYVDIPNCIDKGKVNLEIGFGKNLEFEKRENYIKELDQLISMHSGSIIALSYTTEGYPSIQELESIIKKYKPITHVCYLGKHGFALNKNNAGRQEVLIVGI
jgi:adenine-specific DNA-methyltransferase